MLRMKGSAELRTSNRSPIGRRAPIIRDAAIRVVVENLECRQLLSASLANEPVPSSNVLPAASSFALAAAQTTPASLAYTSLDVNATPAGNTSVVTPGVDYNIAAGGSGVYGSADSFRFVYAQRTGDFDVTVQVSSLTKASSKSEAGLMVRELLTAGSRTVFSDATYSSGFSFGSRTKDKANFINSYTGGTVSLPNVWLRLKRAGNVFTGYRSADGVSWTQMGAINISLPQTVYVGMATASSASKATTTATYRSLGDYIKQLPPAPATGLSVQTVSSSQLNVTWDAVAGATLYRIQRKAPGQSAFTDFAVRTTNNLSDESLAAASSYSYRVRAENGSLVSPYTSPVSAATDPVTPAIPANFSVTAASTSQINLKWNAVANTTRYRIQRKAPGELAFADFATTASTNYSDRGLSSHTSYAYQIRAENGKVVSDYSDPQQANTLSPIPPAAPAILSAQAISTSQIDLTWSAVPDVTLYYVARKGPGDADFVEYRTTTGTVLHDTALQPGAVYVYEVRGEDDGVAGVNTVPQQATTPLPVPTAFTAAASSSEIDLTWNAVADASFYRIQRHGPGERDFTDYATTASVAFQDTGLGGGSAYAYRVRAENDGGATSAYTAPLTRITSVDPVAPAIPAAFSAVANSSTQVTLRWSASNGATLYRVQRQAPTDADFVDLGTTASTTLVDNSVAAGQIYSYRVRAENGASLASDYTSAAAVTTPAAPATHITWSNGADAPIARQEAISIQVGGKLYVWGGFIDQKLNVTNTGYVENLATGKWKSIADTPLMQTHAGVATDGTYIYVAGGQTGPKDSDNAHVEAFKYNISTNKWSTFTNLPDARLGGGLAYLNGFLYFMGGDLSDRLTVSPKTFAIPVDESTGWVDTGASMPDPVDHFSVAVLNDRIYALGGDTDHGYSYISHDTVRYYDPAANTWTVVALMPTPASHFESGTIVVNGRIVAIGGQAPDVTLMNEVRVYDPAADKWTVLEHIPSVRKGGIAAYYNEKLYYISGRAENTSGGHVNSKTTFIGNLTNPW